jgi:hypothetical protein
MVPAEAIAIAVRLYSPPPAAAAAVSLLAWLVAAAAGLWRRIRAVSASSHNKRGSSVRAVIGNDDREPHPPLPSRAAITEEPRPRRPVAVAPAEPSPSSVSELTNTPSSKVRFTAYYYSGALGDDDDGGVLDGVRKCADTDDQASDSEVEMVLRRLVSNTPARRRRRRAMTTLAAAPWEERETMAARRRSDLGCWYRYVDMAALDGSVVRLWDGGVAGREWEDEERAQDWNCNDCRYRR